MADRNALIRGFLRRQQAGRGKRSPGPPRFPSPGAQATTRPGRQSGGIYRELKPYREIKGGRLK